MRYFNKTTEFILHLHCIFNASRILDIKRAFILLKWTTLTACNLLGFPADRWSEWGCIGLGVWMPRTRVSAAGIVCRDRWGEEFKNRWIFSLFRDESVFMDICLYKLNFKICQNNIGAARSGVHLWQSEQLHSKALCLLSLHETAWISTVLACF